MDTFEILKKGKVPLVKGVVKKSGSSWFIRIDPALINLNILKENDVVEGILDKKVDKEEATPVEQRAGSSHRFNILDVYDKRINKRIICIG